MIIIATHNGERFLKNLLQDLTKFDIHNKEICIVDNQSNDESHLKYLEEKQKEGYNVLHNEKASYEWGAFKYAMEHLESKEWFCLQDSIRVHQNIFAEISPKFTDNNVFTFLTFTPNEDDAEYRAGLLIRYGTFFYRKGIFASMIFANDTVMKRFKDQFTVSTNKFGSQMIQRGMAIILEKNNVEINGLADYHPNRMHLFPAEGGFPFFTKLKGDRQ